MFKLAFHGGPVVEVLSTSGKNPLEKWKTSGSITKSFDSLIKGYIYTLDGQAKIQIPKDEKDHLGLIQPFLVFQIFIPLGKNIHIEVGLTDSTKTKRRLIFHSGAKEIVANPLHARIPVHNFRRNQWINLALDIFAFAHHCFKGVNVRSIDLLIVTSCCKLRRIFTMKNPLYDDQEAEDPELQGMLNDLTLEEQRENLPFEYVPKNLGFPQGFVHFNQFIFPQRVIRGGQQADENVNQGNVQEPQALIKGKVQLAFGQRAPAKHVSGSVSKRGAAPTHKRLDSAAKDHIPSTDNDFYTPLASQLQNDNFDDDQEEELKDSDPVDNYCQEQASKKVTKADLKEETHFLYLQNTSDDDQDALQTEKKKVKFNNPWDNVGRGAAAVSQKKVKSPERLQNQKSPQLSNRNGGPKNEDLFYSPLSNNEEKNIRLDSEFSDDYHIQEQLKKVKKLSNVVNTIESKYVKEKEWSPEPQKVQRAPVRTNGFQKPSLKMNGQHKKAKDEKDDEEEKSQSKFTNFNLEQWDVNQMDESTSHFIEEAFDLNHDNLVNFNDKPLSGLLGNQVTQSRDFKENPMFIEFELNNDDCEEEIEAPKIKSPPHKIFEVPPQTLPNQSYQHLESSRRDERRPFSPPFKLPEISDHEPTVHLAPVISEFDHKLEHLKVQRTQILRDSLDQSIPLRPDQSLPPKATVENEEGEVLEVIFDPILKCYYDPQSNSYYELASQQPLQL